MSINDSVVSIFCKHFRFGTDLNSFRKRFRIISQVYVNIFVFICAFGHDSISSVAYGTPRFFFSMISFSLLGLSFILLRNGFDGAARQVTMFYLQVVLLIANTRQASLSTLSALARIPIACMLLGFSIKPMLFHTFLCVFQYIISGYNLRNTFRVTLDDAQADQVFSYLLSAFFSFVYLTMASFLQRLIENTLWSLAQNNYNKAEDLTKEIVQVAEVKNALALSITQEIKNLSGLIDRNFIHLSKMIKEVGSKEILEKIRISSEAVSDLLNNTLEVSRHQNSIVESSYTKVSFVNVITKVFTAYSDILKQKNIFAQAHIQQNFPQELWTEPSILLQIIISLFSSILRFSSPAAKIDLHTVWCPENFQEELLLSPITSTDFKPNENERDRLMTTQAVFNMSSYEDISNEFSDIETRNRITGVKNLRFPENKGIKEVGICSNSTLRQQHWSILHGQNLRNHQISEMVTQSSQLVSQHARSNITSKGYLKVQLSSSACALEEANIDKIKEVLQQRLYDGSIISRTFYLGLWVCKQFCHKMGGDIRAYAKVNRYLTFVFYIPIDNSELLRNMPTLVRPRHKKITSLVVDDYPFNRDLHKLLLEKNEVEVTVASDGQEALDAYISVGGSDYFDFLMMDVQMPIMDGFTAAKKIREWERKNNRRKVDIYFVSGEYFNEEEVMAGFKKQGDANDAMGIRCLRKPIEIEILRNIVKKYKV